MHCYFIPLHNCRKEVEIQKIIASLSEIDCISDIKCLLVAKEMVLEFRENSFQEQKTSCGSSREFRMKVM